jgi:hypothetical protein
LTELQRQNFISLAFHLHNQTLELVAIVAHGCTGLDRKTHPAAVTTRFASVVGSNAGAGTMRATDAAAISQISSQSLHTERAEMEWLFRSGPIKVELNSTSSAMRRKQQA